MFNCGEKIGIPPWGGAGNLEVMKTLLNGAIETSELRRGFEEGYSPEIVQQLRSH